MRTIDPVGLCARILARLEGLPRDLDHELERQLLEDCVDAVRARLSASEDTRWRRACVADAARPGRYVPRPPPSKRHAACLGFGCAGCDGGVIAASGKS